MIKELKQFVGLKKKSVLQEGEKKFFYKDNITVCVLPVVFTIRYLYPGLVSDFHFREQLSRRFPEIGDDPLWAEINVVGKAVCSDNDVFDKKLGETIAYSKAQRKAYAIASRIALFASRYLEVKSAEACKMGHFLKMAADREENFVKSI